MFLVSTDCGMCPNIPSEVPVIKNKDRILFIDDFIYKDSLFHHKTITLRDFCVIDKNIKIYLLFKTDKKKNKRRIVTSKRGDLILRAEEYEKFVKILDPDFYQKYDSKDVVVDREGIEHTIQDCKVLDNFDPNKIMGTTFVNEISKSGHMFKINDSCLMISDVVFDCKCCGDLEVGYLKHLRDMKEINFLYYVTVHNYNTLENFYKLKN